MSQWDDELARQQRLRRLVQMLVTPRDQYAALRYLRRTGDSVLAAMCCGYYGA